MYLKKLMYRLYCVYDETMLTMQAEVLLVVVVFMAGFLDSCFIVKNRFVCLQIAVLQSLSCVHGR